MCILFPTLYTTFHGYEKIFEEVFTSCFCIYELLFPQNEEVNWQIIVNEPMKVYLMRRMKVECILSHELTLKNKNCRHAQFHPWCTEHNLGHTLTQKVIGVELSFNKMLRMYIIE